MIGSMVKEHITKMVQSFMKVNAKMIQNVAMANITKMVNYYTKDNGKMIF